MLDRLVVLAVVKPNTLGQEGPCQGIRALEMERGCWTPPALVRVQDVPRALNGRILLVILLPRHLVVVTMSDFQYSWTCNDRLSAALWTAL